MTMTYASLAAETYREAEEEECVWEVVDEKDQEQLFDEIQVTIEYTMSLFMGWQ